MSKNTTKVAFILPNLGAGGAERVVTILSRAMALRGISVDVVLLLTNKVQYQVPEGVRLVKLNTCECSARERIKRVRAYFRQERKRFNKMVAIPFQDNCLKYALVASVGLRIPVIACERNDPYQKGRSGLARFKAIVPYAMARRCVFQTPDAREYYRWIVKKKSRVIVNPLMLPESLTWHGYNSKCIMSVGRLDPQKNQKILIEAFARIHEQYPDYTLEIYGEGALRCQLQEQIDGLGLHDAAILRGFSSDIHDKLTQCAMFVLPSDYEGMSNALMEALAIGVPTVTTDHPIGGAKMLIDNEVSGLLTPVGDAQALYDAMERLLREPSLALTLSENSRCVRQMLQVDAVVQQWLDMIND